MNRTEIDWVKNPPPPHIKVDANGRWHDPSGKFSEQGYTWNPITGCLNHVNGMCKGGNFPCYAHKLANGRLRHLYKSNFNPAVPKGGWTGRLIIRATDPFYPCFWSERIGQPYLYEKPCGIFVCDMGELFGDWIPRKWQEEIFDVIKSTQRHRYYLLTKQPQNLVKWSPFPDNCWVGVTATNQAMLGDALYWLRRIEATIKYISVEPHLDRIVPNILAMREAKLGWIIDGAQTKPYKPPRIEWVQEIVEAADKASIPVFLKDKLESLLPHTKPFYREVSFGGRFLIYRQELPC